MFIWMPECNRQVFMKEQLVKWTIKVLGVSISFLAKKWLIPKKKLGSWHSKTCKKSTFLTFHGPARWKWKVIFFSYVFLILVFWEHCPAHRFSILNCHFLDHLIWLLVFSDFVITFRCSRLQILKLEKRLIYTIRFSWVPKDLVSKLKNEAVFYSGTFMTNRTSSRQFFLLKRLLLRADSREEIEVSESFSSDQPSIWYYLQLSLLFHHRFRVVTYHKVSQLWFSSD